VGDSMFSNRIGAVMAIAAVLASAVGASEAAERRIALVIGNAAYTNIQVLRNPNNDATEVDKALKAMGFQVLLLHDARKADIDIAIQRFRSLVLGADVGLFYYSGHGFQTNRADQHHPVNHLVPVDFRIPSGAVLENTVPLDEVLRPLETARVSLIFMDACRNDPRLERASRQLGDATRSLIIGRGFAPVAISADAGQTIGGTLSNDNRAAGMLIAYAAAPGNEASDGDDKLSPFTKAFVKHVQSAGVPITDIMGRIGKEVQRDTDNRQHPWYVSELTAPFFLVPPTKRPAGTVIPP
jgi:uncharacterized caspase-like protein